MLSRRTRMSVLMIAVGAGFVTAAGLSHISPHAWQFWGLLAGVACVLSSLYWSWPRRSEEDPEVAALRLQLAEGRVKMLEQSELFEKARNALLTELDSREKRLGERERDLVTRLSRFQEFLEYPIEDVHATKVSGELQKLNENDKKVHQLLEAEAERVYEKIRRNGYTVNGRVDALAIRDEALELIKKVAKVYKPESEFPLLETSFEQLARAASRICLHTLVLLEQLPVSVQSHNINTLYGYIRKAVVGYGVYKQATPWLSYLSRGIYAGRLVATTNPAALGAWWVATELGKKGAQKVVENVVDRQAVALLHDLVTIIGVEAAGIYGTGFRQRDCAWILGTELVELIHAFPASGESLRVGLQKITTLPLRCEYDRVYLYRCLANHRSAGLQLSDSAMLSRDEREAIARELELFFVSHIHGANDTNVKKWRDAFEQRFDLRLKLESIEKRGVSSRTEQIEEALRSLMAFLLGIMNVESSAAQLSAKLFRTLNLLPEGERQPILQKMLLQSPERAFHPPELDPASDVTKSFLQDLASCAAVLEQPDSEIETLVSETWAYFRQTAKEAGIAVGNAWKQKLRWHCTEASLADELPCEAARLFFSTRHIGDKLTFAFTGLSRRQSGVVSQLPDHWLFGTENRQAQKRRAFVAASGDSQEIVWNVEDPFAVERVHGVLIDDAAISNGRWTTPGDAGSFTGDLVVAGSIRGGRFRSYFRPLLEAAAGKETGA